MNRPHFTAEEIEAQRGKWIWGLMAGLKGRQDMLRPVREHMIWFKLHAILLHLKEKGLIPFFYLLS